MSDSLITCPETRALDVPVRVADAMPRMTEWFNATQGLRDPRSDSDVFVTAPALAIFIILYIITMALVGCALKDVYFHRRRSREEEDKQRTRVACLIRECARTHRCRFTHGAPACRR